ncbi:hypothetical protein OG21DRAFT_1387956, partial [Imleria badia]
HHGHCHVSRKGGSDNHYRLSQQEMTLWAKKMSLNEATKFAPPHCLNFDCRPALKSGRRTASTSSIPEVHVTIQNITPDGSSLTSARPGLYWNQLEVFLWEAGITSSEHILLADPTVLALVGDMGTRRAIVLRNHAKRLVLPVLGLRGTYQE